MLILIMWMVKYPDITVLQILKFKNAFSHTYNHLEMEA